MNSGSARPSFDTMALARTAAERALLNSCPYWPEASRLYRLVQQ